ncbi:hypothetical protein [Legionella oakridgensis]|uniref:EF-hand domain-containing protein n=2 Tax=Legionella oakridgensis TaxID=29423 RepID=W0B6G5_9GAMM|nr:hypothetical protein [Legionella oakridgensis]AHE66133.1 hypothetical protein Loa_00563 [Legionella oakridgensis ATCC 33761 = DSM 21215]ETO94193.1 hypothetical protein LOR_42c06250 [Legionella oakridgensis RV-2-2007]KTD43878.1 hypothetical protein Loak_0428 [Legionella oakridgensis]STY16046.1 Uncharacterised protein [Legionella longbeachae]
MGNCCSGFFDRNRDGKVTASEVFKTIGEAINLLGSVAKTAQMYVQALEAAGIDTKGTLDVLRRINTIAEASSGVADTLAKIKVPTKLEEIGDVDGDGDFDKDDVLAYLENSQRVCDALIAAGVNTAEIQKYRDDVQKVIDVVRAGPALSEVHRAVAAPV